jgi:hypothetical protein
MKSKHKVSLLGILAVSTCVRATPSVGPSTVAPTTQSLELVGTWRLVEFWDRDSVSTPKYFLYGEQPTGFFVYDLTGHVFIQIMRGPARPALGRGKGDEWYRSASLDDLRETVGGFRAYFGTYVVDPASGAVFHQVEGDSRAVYLDTRQRRRFRIAGDSLIIGNEITARRVLIRVR